MKFRLISWVGKIPPGTVVEPSGFASVQLTPEEVVKLSEEFDVLLATKGGVLTIILDEVGGGFRQR